MRKPLLTQTVEALHRRLNQIAYDVERLDHWCAETMVNLRQIQAKVSILRQGVHEAAELAEAHTPREPREK